MRRFQTTFFLILYLFSDVHAQLFYTLDSTILQIDIVIDQHRIHAPWDIVWGPDDKLWMTDGPRVTRWDPETDLIDTLLERPYGNGLGMSLHPEFPQVPFLFVVFDTGHYYSHSAKCEVMRFEYDSESERFMNDTILLSYFHAGEHSGGRILFDTTNHLLLTTADYWPANDTFGYLQGKVLRMTIDGSPPTDHLPGDYTFTKGHRNPQGMCTLSNGSVVISEHGQAGNNEINLLSAHQNYGWPVWDGNDCTLLLPDSCTSQTYQNYEALAIFDEPPAGIELYTHSRIPEFSNTLLTCILWYTGMNVFKLNSNLDAITDQSYLTGDVWNYLGRIRDIAIRPDGSFYLITNDRQEARIRLVQPKITTATKETKETPFLVWPNPTRNELFISLNNQHCVDEIQMFDIWGRVLKTHSGYYENQIEVQLPPHIQAGMYFIQLNCQGRKYTERVLVMH